MKKMSNLKINFIGIGAEKAGTTWVADCLREHPEIFIPQKKEIFFFNEYDPHFLNVKNFRYERGIDWYTNQFKDNNLIRGEFSPTYLYCQMAAKRIHRHFPGIKLIIILRDPVRRAYSQYIHDVRLGVIKNISFPMALRKYPNYVEKGLYYKHLRSYLDKFPKENMLILFNEDIAKKPTQEIKKIYRFVEVKDIGFIPDSLKERKNTASQARFSIINYTMLQTEYFLRRKNLSTLLSIFDDVGIRKFALNLREINSKPISKYMKIDAESKMLLKKTFVSDIEKLEKLLKKDLTQWK